MKAKTTPIDLILKLKTPNDKEDMTGIELMAGIKSFEVIMAHTKRRHRRSRAIRKKIIRCSKREARDNQTNG